MSVATCGHEVVHGITTTIDDSQISWDGHPVVTYGTYCAFCIVEFAQAGILRNPELERIVNDLLKSRAELNQANEIIASNSQMEKHLMKECKQELAYKDARIAHLEKEVTRVFEPTRQFWNDQLSEKIVELEKQIVELKRELTNE